jgi:hypothetical protein
MTAATVLNYLYIALPSMEVVTLTCTDAETFVSRKFRTLTGALVTSNYNADAHINVTLSSATATVNWAGQTDKTCTLVLFGNH